VCAPVDQPRARFEIELVPPLPADVGRVVRPPGRRPEPQVPVAHVRRGRRFAGQPGVAEFRHVDRGVQCVEFAELAAAGQFDGLLKRWHTPPLGARLEDATGFLHHRRQVLHVLDRQPTGFFAVDVLAGLCRQDRRRGVPAVARGHDHGVDVLTGQKLPHVPVGHAVGGPRELVHERFPRLATALLHVRDGDAADVGQPEHRVHHVGAAWPESDHPDVDLLGGFLGIIAAGHRCGKKTRKPCRRPERQAREDLSSRERGAFHSRFGRHDVIGTVVGHLGTPVACWEVSLVCCTRRVTSWAAPCRVG
jgi:hypothetical protein